MHSHTTHAAPARFEKHEISLSGVMPEKPVERSAEEIRKMIAKIKFLSQTLSGFPQIKISAEHGCGWACGMDGEDVELIDKYVKGKIKTIDELPPETLKPKVIYCDLDDLANWPDKRIMGVTQHEISHALYTDYKLFFEGQRMAADQGSLPSTWASVWNALEDPWINNKRSADSDAVRAAMTELYAHWIEDTQAKFENVPLASQLGLNIIHHWATGSDIPQIKDETVLRKWGEIKPYAEQYFNGQSARENYDLLNNHIWPVVKDLEAKDVQDRLQQNMSDRLSGNQKKPSNGPNGEAGKTNSKSSSLPSKEKKGLMQKLKDLISGEESEDGETNKSLKKADKNKLGEKLKDKDQSSARRELSAEEKKGLEDIFNSLSQEDKEKLLQEAKSDVEQTAAEIFDNSFGENGPIKKDLSGQYKPSNQTEGEPTELDEKIAALEKELKVAEKREEEQAEEFRQEEIRRLEQEIKQRQMKQYGFKPEEEGLFDIYRAYENEVQGFIANFKKQFAELLPKQETVEFDGEHFSGKRVNEDLIGKRVPVKDYRIYQRRNLVQSEDPKLFATLLIDNSGSMSGIKMRESLKTAIFYAKVFQMFELPFSIKLFGSHVIEIKSFNERYDDPGAGVKRRLVQYANASMGNTDIGEGLESSFADMTSRKKEFVGYEGAIFTISDSGANCGRVGAGLADYIRDIQKKYAVTNFILSNQSSEIKNAMETFGERNVIAPSDFSRICPESVRILRNVFSNLKRKVH